MTLKERYAALSQLQLSLSQRPEEFAAVWQRVFSELRPWRFLEIGSAGGGSFFLYAGACAEGATVVAVDLPSLARHRIMLGRAVDALRAEGFDAHRIEGNSRHSETIQQVKEQLGGPVDFLHIDGWHMYQGAKADWDNYAPMVRPGGIVALHDVVFSDDEAHAGGSGRLLRELAKSGYRTATFVQRERLQGRQAAGIGLVWV